MRYSPLLNAQGGVIDDIIITRLADAPGAFLLVSNASRKAVAEAHLRGLLPSGARLEVLGERALLALQGPEAARVLAQFCEAPQQLRFMQAMSCATAAFGELSISRSGYTGEDGFEIAVDAAHAESLARALLGFPEVMMIGLGARDSLRLEAGLALYGHELTETITPVEAGIAWTIAKRRRAEGGFAGAEIVLAQLAQGPARRLIGVRPEGKAIAREGVEICQQGRKIGQIASGGFGPSVGGPIAMAYVESAYAQAGTRFEVLIRGKSWPAQAAALPFIPHRYQR
jgi:aminomethyltransferase